MAGDRASAGKPRRALFRVAGNGIITGAADDDPSAIGTYANAGALYGLGFLWIAPVLLPMMFVVTYLSAKIGRAYGKGLFGAIRDRFPPLLLYPLMLGAFSGNVIEAAANLGGIGAATNLLVPVSIPVIVCGAGALIVAVQLLGSYDLIRRIFRWLSLALFAYVGAALMAKPNLGEVLRGTFIPHLQLDSGFLTLIVACIGTSLSAYVYTWQSNQEVEQQIGEGKLHWWQRRGASAGDMARTGRDVAVGMVFSNVILYFIIMSMGATVHVHGSTQLDSATQAAAALEPLAGPAAKFLFAAGVIGVGFLAVPVMTTGAAYDLFQAFNRHGHLHLALSQGKWFYGVIALVTAVAVLLNVFHFNPMRALVWSGIVQGFSVPPLLLVMMLITNDRRMMGDRANGRLIRVLGWTTTAVTFAAAGALLVSSMRA